MGVLTAASQLAEQGLKITGAIYDLYKKVRDAPESIRQQSVQIEQLIDIAKLIGNNPSLQTDSVSSILNSCSNEAKDLLNILRKVTPARETNKPEKMWKALAAVSKEKRIIAHLAKLEQGKSTLALCIETIDSALLHTIHLEFVKVQTAVDGISQELPAIRDSIRKVTTVLNRIDALPAIAKDIEGIHGKLPEIASKITTVHDELPEISGKVAAIHDELLPRMQDDMQRLLLNQPTSATGPRANSLRGLLLMPFARNSTFVGRDVQIEDLGSRLETQVGHTRVALVGLGGIGKSQVALEYAHRRIEKEPQLSVFWIHASSASRFEQDYLQIGRLAGVSGFNGSASDPKQLIKDWLSSNDAGTWLLIVDSADDTDILFGNREADRPLLLKGLSEFFPQSSNGSILFTTRNKKAGIKFATATGLIVLPKMDPADAEQLLKSRSGEFMSEGDEIAELLDRLEYLPLALSQAGSYIAENSITISEYLQVYSHSETSRTELLTEEFTDPARDDDAQNPVISTYAVSFDQINRSNPVAADLISYMACLDDQAVPKSLLQLPTSLVKATSALGLLKAYSLIATDRTDTMFSMHRLVHLATRNWLKIHGRFKAWAEISLRTVSEKFPPAGPETLDLCDLYLPHAQAVYAYGQYSSKEDHSQGDLAEKLSWYFKTRGSYHTAVALAEEAVRSRKEGKKLNDPNYLMSVENLNEILRIQSHASDNDTYQQLLPRWEKWYTDWEKSVGYDHQILLLQLENVTASLRCEGEWEALREIHKRMLSSKKKTLGIDHPSTKATREALKSVEQALGCYKKASDSDENLREFDVHKVYDNWVKSLGPGHDITRRSMSNRLAQLKFRERRAGPEDPNVIKAKEALMSALRRHGAE